MKSILQYRHTLYGKERHVDTGVHPITIHITKLGAYLSLLRNWRQYTHMYVS